MDFRNSFPMIFAITILIPTLGISGAVHAQTEMKYRPDEVLVAFRTGTSGSAIASAHAAVGGSVQRVIPRFGLQVVKVASGTVLDQVQVYQRNPNVSFAQPNYLRPLIVPIEGSFGPGLSVFQEQWSLNNTGQGLQTYTDPNTGVASWPTGTIRPGADIQMPDAWDVTLGSSSVQVAVLDSGVDCGFPASPVGHPDLVDKCVDVEDWVTPTMNTFGDPIPDFTDVIGHGTHVAGIIGMLTNNGAGGAGIGWSTMIGSFKVCYAETVLGIVIGSDCPESDIIAAIDRVIQLGTYQVINMSFGGGASPALETALNSAFASGIVLIAAAGNGGNWLHVFPAAYPNVVAIGSTSPVDDRSSFSSFSREDTPQGDWVDLLAPGDPIISTVPGIFCGAHGIDCFGWNRGTSMAAPHASGVAALVWSQLLQSNPTNTLQANRDEVIRRLRDCADHTGAMGQDMLIWSAHGRLNAHGAVTCGPTSPPPPPPTGNYVSDLVSTSSGSGSTWTATGTVTVMDADGVPAGDVVVTGDWDTGDPAGCVTSSEQGQCSMVLANIRRRVGSVVLTVNVPLKFNGLPASVAISKP